MPSIDRETGAVEIFCTDIKCSLEPSGKLMSFLSHWIKSLGAAVRLAEGARGSRG